MKGKSAVLVFAALLLTVLVYQPAQAGVNVGVGVNVGLPAFSFHAPPAMVVIPGTYAYYVPDADVDIFFYQGHWYRSHNGQWYWGNAYNGPWVVRSPRYVPSFFLDLQPGWRQRIVIHERIPYDNFRRNWRNWEKQRYWEKKHDWWNKEKDTWRERREDRHEMKEDRQERKEDHREMKEDRQERKEDRREMKEDRQERKEDRREMKEDRKDLKQDQKGQQKKQQPQGKQKGQQDKQQPEGKERPDDKDKN